MIQDLNLSNTHLLDIADDFTKKIDIGLKSDNTEIKALPTYIHQTNDVVTKEALALDLGGTNFRAAIVSIKGEALVKKIVEKDITEMKRKGFSQKDLFETQLNLIKQLGDIPKGLPIGYCFSYPARSMKNGDSELIKWVKGVNIAGMEGKPVGAPLLEFLNKNSDYEFKKITVVNDTITSLFSGLKGTTFDAYIGLIVGTGTNMATFFNSKDIKKIGANEWNGLIPVNLESGNFHPPHLSSFDDILDRNSDSPGRQRFEKAVSGMYLGSLFKMIVEDKQVPEDFDTARLTYIINNTEHYQKYYVDTAIQVYERSAKLVAASLAGLIKKLSDFNPSIKKIKVLAEGGLFWNDSGNPKTRYSVIVSKSLNEIFAEQRLHSIDVTFSKIDNANLIGAALAVL